LSTPVPVYLLHEQIKRNVRSLKMENTEPKDQLHACNIDIKRPDKTHITAWKDRSEFQTVYDKIFHSPADDIESKEEAVKWLNVWKVRQNREIPICIRCTLVVLEALLFDLRSQRGDRENTTETKNIYAGAFTRFINFVTEGPQNFRWRKTSIAQHVRGLGIETYLVELRHLCAHRSISVSIDVFRRSAQYCMDWLQASYWDRELSTMQPVTILTIKTEEQLVKLPELTTTLRTYDVATAGRAMGFATVSQVKHKLKPDELELLRGFSSDKLKVISSLMLQRLRDNMALPRNSVGVNALCNGILTNCRRMIMAPVAKVGITQKQIGPLGAIHSELFQYLATIGCLQPFFERLIAICENENEDDELRLAAKDWSSRIGMGFQFLWLFKQYARSLPPERLVRFHESSKLKLARSVFQEWFQQRYPRGFKLFPVLGVTIDCPWQLQLSAAYVRNRLAAANSYTRDIIPILLSSMQPTLPESKRQNLETLVHIYIGQGKINDIMDIDEPPSEGPLPKRTANPKAPFASKEPEKIYTKEDIVKALATKRRSDDPVEELEAGSKKIKRSGPWSESLEAIAWERCPLGTYHTMSRTYASSVLKTVVALICETVGFDAASPLALERLISITEHFLREITLHMVRASELNNRSESNLDDLAFAFRSCGIDLGEMLEYTENVGPIPLPYVVGRFPQPQARNRGDPIVPPSKKSSTEG
uniref:Bromodomain associated domain-containing protein n=1 Tax=Anopheles atroparvus TaxID=41427 RepID=A0A182IJB2_ANOAO